MQTVSAPERSLEQRHAALRVANDIRTHRAGLKVDLGAGRKTLAEVYVDPKCQTMKIWDVLVALPKVGRVKANRTLARARISPSKTIGGMTERQRDDLARVLAGFPSVTRGTIGLR